MDDRTLIPAHVFYARWFIRIRWISILILLLSIISCKWLFNLDIQVNQLFIISAILVLINILHMYLLNRTVSAGSENVIRNIKRGIHLQIFLDLLILTAVIHFAGGIENPMIILFFLHMIISSSIFSKKESFIHSGIAILLLASLMLTEAYGIIPHHSLGKPALEGLYQDKLYMFGSGFIFVFTSILIIGLTHLIKNKSITVEETYVKTNRQLEKMSKLQNQYVLRVTHDIKGHLAAILSRLSVVRGKIIGPLNQDQEEFVDRAYKRTEQLSGFVQNILSLSRKRLMDESENEVFSIRDVIDKVCSRIQVLASDKSIIFNTYIDAGINDMYGNPLTIEELYSNLLRNAIHYTPEKGRINLSVKQKEGIIISQVSDSGIGIPKNEINRVFDEFYRGLHARRINKNSSGLGLSIVKQIVKNHGGDIKVDSEPGVWTKFTFTLPVRQITDEPQPAF